MGIKSLISSLASTFVLKNSFGSKQSCSCFYCDFNPNGSKNV